MSWLEMIKFKSLFCISKYLLHAYKIIYDMPTFYFLVFITYDDCILLLV